MNKTQ